MPKKTEGKREGHPRGHKTPLGICPNCRNQVTPNSWLRCCELPGSWGSCWVDRGAPAVWGCWAGTGQRASPGQAPKKAAWPHSRLGLTSASAWVLTRARSWPLPRLGLLTVQLPERISQECIPRGKRKLPGLAKVASRLFQCHLGGTGLAQDPLIQWGKRRKDRKLPSHDRRGLWSLCRREEVCSLHSGK